MTVNDAGEIVVSDDPTKVSYFWYGQEGSSSAFVTVSRGSMNALVYGPGLRFTVNSIGQGIHLYRELSAREVDNGRCASDEVGARLAFMTLQHKSVPGTEVPDAFTQSLLARPMYTARATIMFYYTDASLLQFGNDLSALTAAADALVDQLNQALVNTGDTYYFQFTRAGVLTHIGGYVEQPTSPPITDPYTRFTNHLLAVRNRDIDPGQTPRRDTEGADLAVLVVNDVGEPFTNPPLPVYGVAILQRANCFATPLCQIGTVGYRQYAHAVVSVNALVANFTFSHEVGHMLGGQHDVNGQFAPSQGAYTYSHGYRIDGVARDIMADPECITVGGTTTCSTRQPQFANPSAFFLGTPSPSGTTARDVARTIRVDAEPTGNIYPLTDSQSAPDIFWNGFEY